MSAPLQVRHAEPPPVVRCDAQHYFTLAAGSLARGEIVTAACELREGIRRHLLAECKYHFVELRGADKRSPTVLVRALVRAGELADFCASEYLRILELCNKLAHLQFVTRQAMADAISTAVSYLEHSPYLLPARAAIGGVV